MKVIVTGAAGLVGRKLVPALAQNHEVWAVTRHAHETPPGVHSLHADLASSDATRGFPETADVVIHLAQSARYAEFPHSALDVFGVNVGSTARLLDWARAAGARQFILASSGVVTLPGHERSYYAASKRSAELLASCYEQLLTVLVLRFFFVYGAGQRASMLVPRLVATIRAGSAVRLVGANGPLLNPIHVDDAIAAVECGIERRVSGTMNIAGPDVLNIRQMSETIARLTGHEPRFAQDPGSEPPDLTADISIMRDRLVPPLRSFEHGVADVIEPARNVTK